MCNLGGQGEGFRDAMGFAGWAPEVINGRLAMVGVLAGFAAELRTHESLGFQFSEHVFSFSLASAVFTLASFLPSLCMSGEGAAYTANPRTKDQRGSPFTAEAELVNGRAACVGMVAALVTEHLTGASLL